MGIKKTDSAKQIPEVFVKIFINYMDFQNSSLLIEIPNSQEMFGRNSANKLGSLLT